MEEIMKKALKEMDKTIKRLKENQTQQPEVIACQGGREMFKTDST